MLSIYRSIKISSDRKDSSEHDGDVRRSVPGPLTGPRAEKVTPTESNTRAVTSLPPPGRGGRVRIGRRPRPIRARTHGKRFKKIRPGCPEKLSPPLHLHEKKEKRGRKAPTDFVLDCFSVCGTEICDCAAPLFFKPPAPPHRPTAAPL